MKRRDFVKAAVAASMTIKAMAAKAMTEQPVATPATSASLAPPAAPARPTPVALAPGPVPWTSGLLEVKPLGMTPLVPDAVAQTNAHFFNDRQMATLRQLSEVLVPPYQGYPGAIDAGAPEFLDFLIGVSPPDRQQLYQAGLDRLEAEAKQRFGESFAAVDRAQADQLLRPWLRTWITDHPPTEPYAKFINIAHSDIRAATINSQAWNDAVVAAGRETPEVDLYWFPIDPDIHRGSPATVRPSPPGKRRS